MITEDYVSFETAKLLKEKGFNEPTIGIYYKDGTFEYFSLNKWNSKFIIPISAPTLQMAMRWLREVHNIHIAIVPCEVGPGVMDYTYILYKVDTENFIFKDLEIQGRANTDKMSASKTCEEAIKYCLENLI